MTIWKLIAHHKNPESAVAWMHTHERIAIGWNRVGDVRDYASEEVLKAAIRERYPVEQKENPNNSHLGAPSLWGLCHMMRTGDLVIIPRALVVQVEGPYEFAGDANPPEETYQHQRRVSLTRLDPEVLWTAAGGKAPEGGVYQTLIQCAKPLSLDDVISLAHAYDRA